MVRISEDFKYIFDMCVEDHGLSIDHKLHKLCYCLHPLPSPLLLRLLSNLPSVDSQYALPFSLPPYHFRAMDPKEAVNSYMKPTNA